MTPAGLLERSERVIDRARSDVLRPFAAATRALLEAPDSLDFFDGLSDDEVLSIQAELAAQRRLLDSRSALIAAQIARRSARELGANGLAQRGGYRTPEELVRITTGATAMQARQFVRVGVAVDEAQRGGSIDVATGEMLPAPRPWLTELWRAVQAGELSVASADSIANGLGEPDGAVTESMLADAAITLLSDGLASPSGRPLLDADRLYRRARHLRDEMDLAGVAEREEERRAARSLRLYQRPNGMSRLTWEMDPETAAVVRETYDQLTSPRRGGPRFVSSDAERVDGILRDPRTTEQLASDGFLELLRIGTDVAPTTLIGLRRPAVRVLVDAEALADRHGSGSLEGQPDPVAIATVERYACASGVQQIPFDATGQPLDVGREQRFYTPRQRIALAARDGGCRWPGCDRPPSWTEAHHITHWVRDQGRTDVADGILLCRHHHLLAHNNGWEIRREGAEYLLIPPRDNDPEQVPIRMPSRRRAPSESPLSPPGQGKPRHITRAGATTTAATRSARSASPPRTPPQSSR